MTAASTAVGHELAWVPYADARSGLAFQHPAAWSVQRGRAGLLASVVAPRRAAGLAPNLNVVRKVNDHDYTLDDLARAAIREVQRVLTDAALIDLDAAVVADEPARRLLFSYRQGVYGLTGEQWVWLTQSHLWTVTAGARTEDYDASADIFAQLVCTMRIDAA